MRQHNNDMPAQDHGVRICKQCCRRYKAKAANSRYCKDLDCIKARNRANRKRSDAKRDPGHGR